MPYVENKTHRLTFESYKDISYYRIDLLTPFGYKHKAIGADEVYEVKGRLTVKKAKKLLKEYLCPSSTTSSICA